jgi:hypothetical protein
MDSYWDLYVAYVHHCVEYNKKHDIDPHHYEMEWNHWLPKASFPDIPLGQWLTLSQHAIASALQTLALRKNCLCAWHKKHLPTELLELAWPFYRKRSQETMGKWTAEQRTAYAIKSHQKKDPAVKTEIGRKGALAYWGKITEESRELRSANQSERMTKQWASLTDKEKSTRLQNARKSLMRGVCVTLLSGSTILFDSISEAGLHFSVTRKVISYLVKTGKSRPSLNIAKIELQSP